MDNDTDRKDIHNSAVPVICRSCEARHRGICGALDDRELVEFASHTRRSVFRPGEELQGEAEETASYGTVLRGVVKLTKTLRDGRQQLVGLQFAPDFIGRLFGKEARAAAQAVGEVEVCRLSRTAFEHMLQANSGLEHRVTVQALRELDEARDWLVTVGRKSAAEKVASFLHLIATHADPSLAGSGKRSASFELPLTRADIADFLGITIETVSRQLTHLRSEGVILIVNIRKVEVPDLDRLAQRCG